MVALSYCFAVGSKVHRPCPGELGRSYWLARVVCNTLLIDKRNLWFSNGRTRLKEDTAVRMLATYTSHLGTNHLGILLVYWVAG
jgi:hypothetical protein